MSGDLDPGAPASRFSRFRRTLAGLLAIGFVACSATAARADRFTAANWRRVKTYDMAALAALDPLPLRSFVGVRLNYRHETIRHLKPNWYQGSIWAYHRDARDEFSHIPIMVAAADLAFFKTLPTALQSARTYTVYGQVLKDADSNFLFLRLLGTRVKHGKRGIVTVGW